MSAALRHLLWVGRAEAVSFLVLVGIAMPLKYAAGMPLAVRIVGMAHGLLFVLYVYALIRVTGEEQWPRRRAIMGFVASLVPFGPFWFERGWRPEAERAKLRAP